MKGGIWFAHFDAPPSHLAHSLVEEILHRLSEFIAGLALISALHFQRPQLAFDRVTRDGFVTPQTFVPDLAPDRPKERSNDLLDPHTISGVSAE